MSEWTFETDYFKGYEEGKRQAERTYNLKQAEKGRQDAFKLGKQSAVNDIIEILYNTNLLKRDKTNNAKKQLGDTRYLLDRAERKLTDYY